VTSIAEWTRELGVSETIYGLVDEALNVGDLPDEDRFWAEDTLAFFDVDQGEVHRASERVERMRSLLDKASLESEHRAAFLNKKILLLSLQGNIAGIRAIVSEIAIEDAMRSRIGRYNVACAELKLGDKTRGLEALMGLAEEYLQVCGLTIPGIFGVGVHKLAEHLAARRVETDDVRHAADCFDAVSKALRKNARTRAPAALWALWAMKFFDLAGAPLSIVRAGQDVADDLLAVTGSPEEARSFIENDLLRTVKRFGLAAHAIEVRAQYAVICAHCGDFERAESEMRALEPYVAGLPPEGQSGIAGQIGLIAELKASAALHSRAAQPALQQKVGRNEPCPCGSGRKFKKCCGQ
jgi:hypothetical protein